MGIPNIVVFLLVSGLCCYAKDSPPPHCKKYIKLRVVSDVNLGTCEKPAAVAYLGLQMIAHRKADAPVASFALPGGLASANFGWVSKRK